MRLVLDITIKDVDGGYELIMSHFSYGWYESIQQVNEAIERHIKNYFGE